MVNATVSGTGALRTVRRHDGHAIRMAPRGSVVGRVTPATAIVCSGTAEAALVHGRALGIQIPAGRRGLGVQQNAAVNRIAEIEVPAAGAAGVKVGVVCPGPPVATKKCA